MKRYAESTTVSVDRTKAEIDRVLTRYGASAFGYAWEGRDALVSFKAHDRFLQFRLPLPEEKP
jgi:hypothetical protein